MPQQVEQLLRSIPTSDRVRAAAWDAVYTVEDDAQAQQMLRGLQIPDEAKATLWDARQAQRAGVAQPGTTPQTADVASAPELGMGEQAKGFVSGLWSTLNPVAAVRSGMQAVQHPIATAQAMLESQGRVGQEALQAFGEGDVARGARKGLAWMLPVIGPALDSASDKMEAGRIGEGAGESIGLGLTTAAPGRLVGKTSNIPSQSRLNPRTAAAVQFGEREGIPIDAATATDSRFVRSLQRRASDSLGGQGTAERFNTAQQEAFDRVGSDLATRANAGGPAADAVSAGRSVMGRLEDSIRAQASDADQAYSRLRAIEQRNPIPVNVASAKQALKPLYDSLLRESQLTTLQGGKARTLVALDRLMTGPDDAPLSVVDAALGDLKAMARTSDMPELRTQGQATAAEAVSHLEAEVQAAARRGGRAVVEALQAGREATVGKYKTAAVRDQLSGEPAQIFQQLTAGKDVHIDRLRAVANEAPMEVPLVARAYLEGLMEKATAAGGFKRADGLWADWQRLGPETKAVLFPDRGLRSDLNNFFLLAKKAAENPNPSGTASVLTVTNLAASVPFWALAKLMYTRQGVQLLTRGLSIPWGNKTASAAWQAQVANLIGRDAGAALPAVADEEPAIGAPQR